jgi:ATP-binding cassette, subfamily B (MDR/TAP), member 1
MEFQTGFSDKSDAAYKESSNLIMESMVNIRTVSSFGYENVIFNKYEQKLVEPFNLAVKKGNISGIMFGFSQIVMFLIFALIFYIGTIFIRDAGVSVADFFTAIYAITFSAMTVGNNAHFLPDMASGKNSAASLFEILDSEDEDQRQIREESKLIKTGIKGEFELKNIEFKYESRSNYVFEDFSLKIKHGSKVAFVGHSGCGKSTIFQLLQRLYEPSKG